MGRPEKDTASIFGIHAGTVQLNLIMTKYHKTHFEEPFIKLMAYNLFKKKCQCHKRQTKAEEQFQINELEKHDPRKCIAWSYTGVKKIL